MLDDCTTLRLSPPGTLRSALEHGGHPHQMDSLTGIGLRWHAQRHCRRDPAARPAGVARPLVMVAREWRAGWRRLDVGLCRRDQTDHRRECHLPGVYCSTLRGPAERLGAPRAAARGGLADAAARPARDGLFL